ncbi:MAG: MFS transporter [Alphaproteobacteria bacterium]|nr:MFS transporter [Alphaproteobacteria bacterium]
MCGGAASLFLLITARLAQGVGAAILMSLSVALISRVVPKERIGSAMGLVGATSAVGTALGPSLGGGLLYLFGWQGVFLIHVPLTLLFFLAFKHLAPQEEQPLHLKKSFDYTGTFLLATCLASYALLMTLEETFFCKTNACFLLTCLISFGLFILTEQKARFPLVPLGLFTQCASTGHLTMGIVTSGILMTNLVVGPYYLTHGMGLSTQVMGLVMSFGPLIVVMTGVPAGRLVDRYGTKSLTLVGLLSLSLGSFLLALIPVSFGIPGYLAPVTLIAGGYALFQTANNTALMTDVMDHDRGMMSGLLNLSRYLGLMTGACAMGAVFAFATDTSHIETAPAQNVAVGMHATFAVTSILGACIALLLLLRGWLRSQPR